MAGRPQRGPQPLTRGVELGARHAVAGVRERQARLVPGGQDVHVQVGDLEARDQDGRPFEIVEIPMPSPVVHDGQRLPATYINSYFVNGALLVPTYRDKKNDRKALQILQSHLPSHKVIGIDCLELIWGLGAIHCLTQQIHAIQAKKP